MTRQQVHDHFDSLQPDSDAATEVALLNPRLYLWSYRLGGVWYTCRAWSEVVDVANEADVTAEVSRGCHDR